MPFDLGFNNISYSLCSLWLKKYVEKYVLLKIPADVRGWEATTKYPSFIPVIASSTVNFKINLTFLLQL